MLRVRKANINLSLALVGWRNLDNPITQDWVFQETASETDVGLQVFIRDHWWDEELWKGEEGPGLERGEIKLQVMPDSLSHPTGNPQR